MITAIIVLIVLVAVYFELPLWVQMIISVLNFLIPDPIPIIDEVLMVAGMLSKLKLFRNVLKILFFVSIVALIVFSVQKIGTLL